MTQCSRTLAVGCNVISVGTETTSQGSQHIASWCSVLFYWPESGFWVFGLLFFLEGCSCDFTACALRPLLHSAHKVAHPVYSVSLCLNIRGDLLALYLVVVSGIKFVHKVLCESRTVKVQQTQNMYHLYCSLGTLAGLVRSRLAVVFLDVKQEKKWGVGCRGWTQNSKSTFTGQPVGLAQFMERTAFLRCGIVINEAGVCM